MSDNSTEKKQISEILKFLGLEVKNLASVAIEIDLTIGTWMGSENKNCDLDLSTLQNIDRIRQYLGEIGGALVIMAENIPFDVGVDENVLIDCFSLEYFREQASVKGTKYNAQYDECLQTEMF